MANSNDGTKQTPTYKFKDDSQGKEVYSVTEPDKEVGQIKESVSYEKVVE